MRDYHAEGEGVNDLHHRWLRAIEAILGQSPHERFIKDYDRGGL